MYLLLLGTLAFAQDATYSTTTTRTSDYGFTSGEDDEKDCEKTHAGCVDDLTTDYDTYVRLLDGMIGGLHALDWTGQLDAGAGLGIIDGDVAADIWTEKDPDVAGKFTEHWFTTDYTFLTSAHAPFILEYDGSMSKGEMSEKLQSDPPTQYIRMDIQYAELPQTEATAQLNYPSDSSVIRYAFEGRIDSNNDGVINMDDKVAAFLLRERHLVGGFETVRYEHWLFMNSKEGTYADYKLLDQPGEQLELFAVDPMSPQVFYNQFQAEEPGKVERAAVFSYIWEDPDGSGFLD